VRLSGVLRADRVEALLAMLAAEFGVRAERHGGAIELHAQR
jgi:ferric-dicitrate binding protein FerR (iron transport regulator)